MIELRLSEVRKMVVLTGAGVSVASGLPTYRGEGGLWEREGLERYATASAWVHEPLKVWKQFAMMRAAILAAEPNAAHRALAAVPAAHVITQNVDGLHQAAGTVEPIELHGNLRRTRCSNADCDLEPFDDPTTELDELPRCPSCGDVLRPDIVLFDELLPVDASWRAKHALRDCDLFIAVGTSGTVTPASNFVRSAKYEGARTILVNLEPMDPPNPYFDEEVLGRAEDVLPRLLGVR